VIRLVIAEDHAIVRSGLKQIFATTADVKVVGEAVDGGSVLDCFRQLDFDLLLLDLNMPGLSGAELIARLKSQYPTKPILVLSMHNTVQVAARALKAGANGYCTKDSEPEVLLDAIRKVARGGKYLIPELAEQMIFASVEQGDALPHTKLSDREMQIFSHLVKGVSVNDIADQLNISNKTVSTHKVRLMEKLNTATIADLILYAVRHQLMD
jgi:DNA-binding NarL/FixJ family response regulator